MRCGGAAMAIPLPSSQREVLQMLNFEAFISVVNFLVTTFGWYCIWGYLYDRRCLRWLTKGQESRPLLQLNDRVLFKDGQTGIVKNIKSRHICEIERHGSTVSIPICRSTGESIIGANRGLNRFTVESVNYSGNDPSNVYFLHQKRPVFVPDQHPPQAS